MFSVMPALTQADAIKYLVARKFPFAQALRASSSISGRPSAFSPTDRTKTFAEADAYEKELRAKAWSELQSLYAQEKEAEQAAWRAKMEKEERERFFNLPSAQAEYPHWAKMAYWSLEEAVALSFGKEPKFVSFDTLKKQAAFSPFVRDYERRRDLIFRAKAIGQLSDGVLPGYFLAWAKRNRIPFPAELEAAVTEHGHQVADWKTNYDNLERLHEKLKADHQNLIDRHNHEVMELADGVNEVIAQRDAAERSLKELKESVATAQPLPEATPRERNNLLRLVITMAAKKYGFDPRKSKNSATQNIVAAMEEMGVKLSEDTVLKYLREAGDLIDWSAFDEQKKS